MSTLSWLRQHRKSVLAFFAVWFVYGFMTNANDLHLYGLYQVGAESIVDFQTFTVGHSHNPEMRDAGDGDIFSYQDQTFIAKQPGSFVAAAIPYVILKLLGYDYVHDYRFVAAVTSWFSAGLLAALSVVLFYHFLLSMGYAPGVTLAVAMGYGFGTTLFPYTGVPHHDVIASCLFFFGFMMLLRLSKASTNAALRWSGLLLGLVPVFSMLPALMVATLLVFSLFYLGVRKAIHYGVGFAIGVYPLLLYNYYYFDSPLKQANMAGDYENTFFAPTLDQFHIRVDQYFGILSNMSATKNMPIFVLGLAGLFFLKPKLRQLQILILVFVLLQFGYLFNIGTEGHCQFGPRYFIPLIPFVMMGFASWFETRLQRWIAWPALVASIAINTLGALGDSMQCSNLLYFAPTHIYEHLGEVFHQPRPLLPLMAAMSAVGALASVILILRERSKR